MPSLHWVSVHDLDPDHDYVVMATRFVVTSRWRLPGVMNSTQQLWQSLSATSGLAGYAFSVSPLRGSLSTLTAWHDRSALMSFARSPVHASLVTRTSPMMKSSRFTEWMSAGADLPAAWKEAHDRSAGP